MKIEMNIEKRYALLIISIILIIGMIIGVYAVITADKPNPGHSINEVEGIECTSGQAITRTTSGWGCVDLTTGTQSSSYLVDNFVNPTFTNYANLYDIIDSELAWIGKGAQFFHDDSASGTISVSGEDKYIKFDGYGKIKSDKIDPKQPFDIEFKVKIPNSATLSSNRPIRLANDISGPSNYVGIADNPTNTNVWATRVKSSGQPEISVDLTPKVKGVWTIFRIRGDGTTIKYYVDGVEKTTAAVSVSSASVPSTTLDFYVGGLSSSGTSTILVDYVKIKTPWTDKVVSGIVR